MTSKSWTVEVALDEQVDQTLAEATLSIEGRTTITGRGMSRRNPSDESVPRIGDELATARALSDLSHQLLDVAAGDIESHTHQRVDALQL